MNADMGEKIPASFQISRQLDQEKINFLTLRVEELVKSNNDLRTSSDQNEKDTHDIVLYFQREMEIKDDVILRLNEELVKCQTQLKFEVEKVRRAFEDELADIRNSSESTISTLTVKLENSESELKSVYAFKQAKDQHEGTILKLEKQMQSQREQLIDAMEEQERRFLEEKSQLFKDLDEQKAAFREIALQDARSAMGEEAKKILADNNRMFEELKFHHSEAADFQAEKNVLTTDLATAKREIEIYADKEMEYAKQAHMRSKEIKALRERVEMLERQQKENNERFKTRAKELKSSVTKELQEATLDAAGLRRLIQIKNKELRHMKSLAATILSQRTEVEHFFLESLQEVKDVIQKERRISKHQARKAMNTLRSGTGGILSKSLGHNNNNNGNNGNNSNGDDNRKGSSVRGVKFPPLNVKGSQVQYFEQRQVNTLQFEDLSKITIRDLSWEDKELVLRVLFSKMNGIQGNINRGISNAARKSQQQQQQQLMPEPVFLSEGANLPGLTGATAYQGNFEIDKKPLRSNSNSSRREEEEEDDYYDNGGGDDDEELQQEEQQDGDFAYYDEEVEGEVDGESVEREGDRIDYDDDDQFDPNYDALGAEINGGNSSSNSSEVEMKRLMTNRVSEVMDGILNNNL